jgi:4-amino-4-deoxy-L-arabinose transferase-like glycosyltransferase
MKWPFAVLAAALLLARLPSLVQPAGGDQGIYAYVGESILRGDVPYRDAWDQKPPGVHLTYAAMFAVWRNESVVATADLVAAGLIALLLVALGRRLTGRTGAGVVGALVFLLLGDPSFQRLGGLWVRAQAETFVALVVTAALLAALVAVESAGDAHGERRAFAWRVAAGILLGLAFLYKYNAGAYVLPAVAIFLVAVPDAHRSDPRNRGARVLIRRLPALVLGFVVPLAGVGAWLAVNGALEDLFQATVVYNVKYSGETYAGAWEAVRYLLVFPVRHARVDALWFVGGIGSALLVVASFSNRRMAIAPMWVAAACLSIAVNGSRELPQYFVQAAPALALAAGMGWVLLRRALGTRLSTLVVLLLAIGVARVNQFDKWADSIGRDIGYLRGRTPRSEYLARFGGQRPTDKFSALASTELGDRLKVETGPSDRVLVLGFSPNALVRADRRSASRFFWSRPLLVGFDEGRPGYGVEGLLEELKRNRPAEVILQEHDWPAEGVDSVTWFLRQPALAAWLAAGYRQEDDTGTYLIWRRSDLP